VMRRAARRVGAPLSTAGSGLHSNRELWPAQDPQVSTVTLSWEGSDERAHTPDDRSEAIDVAKLEHAGRLTALSVMVLAGDPGY
jgi:hypothetical protein